MICTIGTSAETDSVLMGRRPRQRGARAEHIHSRAMVPQAELRVFQPLEAFEPHEQAHWERHIVDGAIRLGPPRFRQEVDPGRTRHPHAGRTRGRVREGRRRPDLRLSVADPAPGAGAGCSRSGRRRRSTTPTRSSPPPPHGERCKQLRRLRRREPGHVSAIMQSPWHVPVRWFVLFVDEERRLRDDDDGRASPVVPHDHEEGDPARRATWSRSSAAPSSVRSPT